MKNEMNGLRGDDQFYMIDEDDDDRIVENAKQFYSRHQMKLQTFKDGHRSFHSDAASNEEDDQLGRKLSDLRNDLISLMEFDGCLMEKFINISKGMDELKKRQNRHYNPSMEAEDQQFGDVNHFVRAGTIPTTILEQKNGQMVASISYHRSSLSTARAMNDSLSTEDEEEDDDVYNANDNIKDGPKFPRKNSAFRTPIPPSHHLNRYARRASTSIIQLPSLSTHYDVDDEDESSSSGISSAASSTRKGKTMKLSKEDGVVNQQQKQGGSIQKQRPNSINLFISGHDGSQQEGKRHLKSQSFHETTIIPDQNYLQVSSSLRVDKMVPLLKDQSMHVTRGSIDSGIAVTPMSPPYSAHILPPRILPYKESMLI